MNIFNLVMNPSL